MFPVQNQSQLREVANTLNPLAPCFTPGSTRSTLNPNAPVFSPGVLVSNLDATPPILEIHTPDVSFGNILEGDQESFAGLETESLSVLVESVPNPAELALVNASSEIGMSVDDQESLSGLSNTESFSEPIEQVPNQVNFSASQLISPTPVESVINLESPKNILKSLRQKNIDRIIIGSLNINSIPNKIELMGDLIRGQVDIFLVTETKLDKSFPPGQFKLEGFADPTI